MNKTTKQLIKYCESRIKETPEIKNGYYHLKKKELLKQKLT